jgi:hypothetical protein
MLMLLRNSVNPADSAWRSSQFTSIQHRLRLIYNSRYTPWLLLFLGVLRTVVFLLAYPPAHGADSGDYFLYAAQFKGLDAPIVFQLIYPLYPLMIYLSFYVLHSIYWLIGLQLVVSALQGVIFYWGLRLYSPALGFVVALMVLGDPQTGILYNFTSTEPFYMFLLNLAFCLYLVQIKHPAGRRIQRGDIFLGITLALVLLMRPVGRYLIVPFGLFFLLGSRSFWRTAVVGVSYGIMLVLSMLFNQVVFDHFELNGGGSFMLNRPLVKSGLLEADNGPASAQLIDLQNACRVVGTARNRCFIDQMGSWPAVRRLYANAYQEMLKTHSTDFAKKVFNEFTDFLRLPGLQYHASKTPSGVQCADISAKTERDTQTYVERDVLLYGTSDATYDQLYPIVQKTSLAMCPPWPSSSRVKSAVDWVALHYRSLARPHPYLWYGELGVLVLLIPWARRLYLLPVLLAGAILANHAAISAVVLNVQPRYIAVTNPYKGFLLLVLVYFLTMLILRVADGWLAARHES